MDIETLNSKHSHAGYITFKEGPGGFPVALITTPHATAAVTSYGAHLLSYTFASDPHDLLFLSQKARFSQGTAIRGGVPVCWPWFGPDPQHLGRSDHGLARTRMWNVAYTALTPEQECIIAFELTDTPETHAIWPHPFRLTLRLSVGKTLTLELTTYNRGETPFELTQALHTYCALGDISRTRITGLEGSLYTDKNDNCLEKIQDAPIAVDAQTDRIYHHSGGDLLLIDDSWGRTVRIDSEGSRSSVIWNPWIEVCKEKEDLENDDYRRFICIETANAGEDAIVVQPGQSHTLKSCFSLE